MLVIQSISLIGSQLFLRSWLCFWVLYFKIVSLCCSLYKTFSLVWLSFVHSIKMCLIECWFPHGHFGGGSSLRMKEWVNWVCPMRSRVKLVSSLLLLLGSSFLSFKMECIWQSLLWGFSSHNCCHFLFTICLILGLRSVYGILMFLSGVMLIAALANEPALSLPWIPIWLRIQQNIIFLLWISELSLLKILTIYGFSNLVYLIDWKTEMDSEWMISLFCIVCRYLIFISVCRPGKDISVSGCLCALNWA